MCTSLFFPRNVWKKINKGKSKKAAFGECFTEWWRIFCANQVLDAGPMTWINLPWRPLEAQLKAFEWFALETCANKSSQRKKVLKWVTLLLLNFQNRKTNPTETQLKHKVNSAGQKLNFHCVHWQQSMNSPLISKQEAVPCHTVNDKWLVWENRSTGSWRRLQRFGSLDSKQLWLNQRRVSRQFCAFSAIPCISKAVFIDGGNLLWK